MFGIGETELVMIVVFGFLLFGPDKLPGMGRTLGRFLRQFREAQEGFTQVVQAEVMDPLNEAMMEPGQTRKTAQAGADEDADIEGDAPRKARGGETFAERKARLKAEREAREAAEKAAAAAEAEGSEPADGAEADEPQATADGAAEPVDEDAPEVSE